MYWHAEKNNGEIIVLTEKEALIHFEKNNISQRMRLRFIGTSSGKHQAEAKQKIKQIIIDNRPKDFNGLKPEEKNLVDFDIREAHDEEIKQIIKEAGEKELEEARQNGVKTPDKSLHIHTRSTDGHSRNEILDTAKGMLR